MTDYGGGHYCAAEVVEGGGEAAEAGGEVNGVGEVGVDGGRPH
jgi:hypothetical protein